MTSICPCHALPRLRTRNEPLKRKTQTSNIGAFKTLLLASQLSQYLCFVQLARPPNSVELSQSKKYILQYYHQDGRKMIHVDFNFKSYENLKVKSFQTRNEPLKRKTQTSNIGAFKTLLLPSPSYPNTQVSQQYVVDPQIRANKSKKVYFILYYLIPLCRMVKN